MIESRVTMAVAARAFDALDAWVERNGWAGHDPYDVRGQDGFVRLFGGDTWFQRKARSAFALTERRLPPMALRRVLGVRPTINAKGMGLMASAQLARHRTHGSDEALAKARRILDWLRQNPATGHPGLSWGYPFHWNSRKLLPRGTPSVVVSGTVGDAWLDHHAATGDPASLANAHRIAEFFLGGLNRPVDDGERLCFSYTPLDDFTVINANLFAAAFLARLDRLDPRPEYADAVRRATRYTLSEQKPDGSWAYWGGEPDSAIDHYHTGFVLRHLHTVRRCTNDASIGEPLARGYAFYLERLFDPDTGAPKMTPESLYPVNIHSCAEALLCLAQLSADLGGAGRIPTVLEFTLKEMREPGGWFIAELRERRRRTVRVRIPYLRWGQAWMLLALARTEEATACA